MKLKLIRFLFLIGATFATFLVRAQEDKPDLRVYKAEIGLSGGGSYYLGDANSQLFSNMQLAYGGFFRYILNPRIAFRAEFNNTDIVGNSVVFRNTINSTDFCAEFNFFDLEKNTYKQFSKTFSPYIFAGIGGISGKYTDGKNNTSDSLKISIPFGVGMKVKLGNRWNLNVQWSSKLMLSDTMEGVEALNNPNKLNGTNIFNNDLISTVTVGISFDIFEKTYNSENKYYRW
jgi:hypothetical protein